MFATIVAFATVPSVDIRLYGISRLEDACSSRRVVYRLTLRAHIIKHSSQTDIWEEASKGRQPFCLVIAVLTRGGGCEGPDPIFMDVDQTTVFVSFSTGGIQVIPNAGESFARLGN